MKVSDPEGTTWRVARRWLPWRRRIHNRYSSTLDGLNPVGGDDVFSVVLGLVGLVIALPGIILGILVALEFFLLLLLLPVALLLRVVVGRHWSVVVRREREIWAEQDGGDWQASGLLVHDLAAALERGEAPARTTGVEVAAEAGEA